MIVLTRHPTPCFSRSSFSIGMSRASDVRAAAARIAGKPSEVGDHRQRRCAGFDAAARDLLPGNRTAVVSSYGELGFNWTDSATVWSSVQRDEGTVLLVAAAAAFDHRLRVAVAAGASRPGVYAASAGNSVDSHLSSSPRGGTGSSAGATVAGATSTPCPSCDRARRIFRRLPATRGVRAGAGIVVGAGCALSVFQMFQYWYGIIPFSDTTWDHYRRVFLRWR